jgi:hypothetical protein
MANPVPPQMQIAQENLERAVAAVEKKPVDLLALPWAEIEKALIKLLGGPFRVDRPEHQTLALGVGAVFAARLAREHGAFWFPNRDSLEGAELGFPDALVKLSPFGAAMDALSRSRLQQLEDLTADLRKSLAQAKFSIAGQGAPARLRPDDYMRLFDPGFIQISALDPAKAKQAWDGTPPAAAREIRDALGRTTKLPPEAKKQFESQVVGSLSRLDPARPLAQQPEAARLAELVGHLFAARQVSGIGPEEFWREMVIPVAAIGAAAQFPPVEQEDLEAFAAGAPVIALYADMVPYQTPAGDEDGLLGFIPPEHVELAHGGIGRGSAQLPRLMKVKPDALRALLKSFDPAKARDSLKRFGEYLEQKAGKKPAPQPQVEQIEEAAFALLDDLKRVLAAVDQGADLYVRRLTEAEAASEPALTLLRDALQGPRIILA